MKTSEQKLLGNHLFIKRGLYSHHGIYVGNDKIVHYSGSQQELLRGKVCTVDFKDFSKGREVFVRVYFDKSFTPQETIRRAVSRIDENEYNLIFNNCEHFASWCSTSKEISSQVKSVLWPVTGIPRAMGRSTLGWAFNIRDKYFDVRVKRFLKSYEEITDFTNLIT